MPRALDVFEHSDQLQSARNVVFHKLLQRGAFGWEIEDFFQDACLKAWEAKIGERPRASRYKNIDRNLIILIAYQAFIDSRRGPLEMVGLEDNCLPPSDGIEALVDRIGGEDSLFSRMEKAGYSKAVTRLFLLYYHYGGKALARRLGVKSGTVKVVMWKMRHYKTPMPRGWFDKLGGL